MNHIKHLLFDFGNVLLNLDEHRTWQGLEEILDPKLCEDINEQVFFPFECGLISEDSFFNRLQRRSLQVLQGDVYVKIWNAMLLDLPEHRIHFLEKLKSDYNIYLLSNTNITHLRSVQHKIKRTYPTLDFEALFNKMYFSHDIHLRKPDPKIFEFVLQDASLLPHECLFIDDKIENIEAAQSLGINSYHHNYNDDIADIFEHIVAKFNG